MDSIAQANQDFENRMDERFKRLERAMRDKPPWACTNCGERYSALHVAYWGVYCDECGGELEEMA